MADHETVIAERRIELRPDPYHVRISAHEAEGFWRVEVENTISARHISTTAVEGEESFLSPLIRAAVAGDDSSWNHLAHWGHGALTGRSSRLRPAG